MKPIQIYCAFLGGATIVLIVGFAIAFSAMTQIGALVIVATILSTPALFLKPMTQAKVVRNTKRYAVGLFVFMLILVLAANLFSDRIQRVLDPRNKT